MTVRDVLGCTDCVATYDHKCCPEQGRHDELLNALRAIQDALLRIAQREDRITAVDVKPGDTIVIETDHRLLSENIVDLKRQAREAFGQDPKIVIAPKGIKVTVLRAAEDARPADQAMPKPVVVKP